MATWTVVVSTTGTETYEVEADSRDEAVAAVYSGEHMPATAESYIDEVDLVTCDN